jgi:hypothetical protein
VKLEQTLLSAEFLLACKDQLYLCERGYPVRQVVKLTGDRYCLSAVQRSILRRGVIPEPAAGERRRKLISSSDVRGETLAIDSCNVLAGVGNYLCGKPVYIATDGLMRDAAESAGVFRNDALRMRAAALMVASMAELRPGNSCFYIDAPLTHSRDLSREILRALSAAELSAGIELVESADRVLKCAPGVLVSGDSQIIDTADRVFDLARYVLESRFGLGLPKLDEALGFHRGEE